MKNLFGEETPEPVVKDPGPRTIKRDPLAAAPARPSRVPYSPVAMPKPRIAGKDRPGTKLSNQARPLRSVREGKMRFLGSVDPVQRIYQRSTALKYSVDWSTRELVFGYEDEWLKINRSVGTIEHIDVDHYDASDYRVFVISTSLARRLGRPVLTPKRQWYVPLAAFDEIDKDGNIIRKGNT
jgi:hypothetical protein